MRSGPRAAPRRQAVETKISGPGVVEAKPRARKRSYEAAQASRQGDPWGAGMLSADAEMFAEARTLRDKSRALVRNNPFAAKGVASWASNIVGVGIVPRPATGNPKRDRKIWDAFQKWALACDHNGRLDFYGMQTLLVREMVEGGEVLVRRRIRKKSGAPGDVPLELQVLEADHLDFSRNGNLNPGTVTIQGVEIDFTSQKRTAYWLYPFHPGNLPYFFGGVALRSEPIAAADVLHLYEQQRVATRGVPWTSPIIEGLSLLADYELAEVVRKKQEACVTAMVTGAENPDEDSVGIRIQDADGAEVERFEPGMILRLHGAKDVKFNTPQVSPGYGEFRGVSLMAVAAGLRMPFELISGDLSKVNFSSMRGGLVEFRRLVETIQWQMLIQQVLQPIWVWWCEIAYLADVIDTPYVPVEWSPPEFEWVDPQADAKTALLEVRAGFRSWQDVVAEKGRNPDDVLDEIHDYATKVDDLGLTLDSDPRRTTAQGLQQQNMTEEPGDEPELSRPNRGKPNGREKGRAPEVRTGRAVPRGELQRGRSYDRDRLDYRRQRSPLRLLGRN